MKKTLAKKVVTDRIYDHYHGRSYYELNGKLEDIIKNLTTIMLNADAGGYSNIQINWGTGYCSDDIEWSITGDRLETDKEYEARLKLENRLDEQRKKDRLLKEQYERKEYERLKKKFERTK